MTEDKNWQVNSSIEPSVYSEHPRLVLVVGNFKNVEEALMLKQHLEHFLIDRFDSEGEMYVSK